eukprot:TRINITY_DN3329_c0_g2_i1.p1 TRINITY_DN3329_c0_g2~~TRINITY_DN3329_c0_g2_i1.p1  ORF type:complete len:103 (-),score=11.77 TRINITY_DN3329_c0_g2_i1:65-373(-)
MCIRDRNIAEEIIRALCFDDADYLPSMASPLYSLIWLDKRLFQEAKRKVMTRLQSTESVEKLSNCLEKLMDDVEFNADPINRDKFLFNYTAVSESIKSIVLV